MCNSWQWCTVVLWMTSVNSSVRSIGRSIAEQYCHLDQKCISDTASNTFSQRDRQYSQRYRKSSADTGDSNTRIVILTTLAVVYHKAPYLDHFFRTLYDSSQSTHYPAVCSMGGIISLLLFFLSVRLRLSQSVLCRLSWNFTWWFGRISDRFSPVFGG